MTQIKTHVLCCGGTGCKASASDEIVANFQNILKERGLQDEVQVIKTGCFGFCEKGPIVKILPDNTFYTQVKPTDVVKIVDEHIIKGRKVTDLLYLDPENKTHVSDSKHMGFYKKQLRIALRNCGFINPVPSTSSENFNLVALLLLIRLVISSISLSICFPDAPLILLPPRTPNFNLTILSAISASL